MDISQVKEQFVTAAHAHQGSTTQAYENGSRKEMMNSCSNGCNLRLTYSFSLDNARTCEFPQTEISVLNSKPFDLVLVSLSSLVRPDSYLRHSGLICIRKFIRLPMHVALKLGDTIVAFYRRMKSDRNKITFTLTHTHTHTNT
ncbi:uncharacterized protein MYCFIDRAFT_170052 [Pseudocercospora fijiensis CIRAD86]|uniref:Uncharacterized protein n=1 Tax=Pseudocercospora fijiensis (strain CIRAD86) TaxID=383855 RepID=N1Q751_PSEFD|nr:uncharacterized protein MYCFIDRAFT_170052 [Pseudocercospora fijiensis CIRAD86]EME88434.1 hypothetical protein MYCFIDRAFT_170052 [Pseudocercospora fijiensis CIRAD86]